MTIAIGMFDCLMVSATETEKIHGEIIRIRKRTETTRSTKSTRTWEHDTSMTTIIEATNKNTTVNQFVFLVLEAGKTCQRIW